jgi:predicted nucleic acid-binding protein
MARPVRIVSDACAGPMDHDFGRLAGFLQTQRFLDRDFVERVHRHLDVGEFNARSIALDADLDVVIDHPLYRH